MTEFVVSCVANAESTIRQALLHGNAMSFKFELDRLTDYSTADIVNEIRRVADVLAVSPLKKREFDSESMVHSRTIRRRFGSWQAGLEAAGRGHLYGGASVTEKMRIQKGRELRDDDLLEELRRVAQALGRNDLTIDDIDSHSIVGEGIFRKRFGTTRRAIERAGLTVRPQSRRYTNDNASKTCTRFGRIMVAVPASVKSTVHHPKLVVRHMSRASAHG